MILKSAVATLLLVFVLSLLMPFVAVTPLLAQSPSVVTWTNAGGGYCLPIMTVNGQPVAGGQVYCPQQSTSFISPDGGASLYMGDDILEASYSRVVRGSPVITAYNADGTIHAFTTTDSFTALNGDAVTATQNFVRTYSLRCVKYGCHKYSYDTNIGGSGTLTDAQ